MAINIQIDSEYCKTLHAKNCKVHHVPCKIKADTQANVDTFFEKCIEKDEQNKGLTNSFRGYPLQGKAYEVPEGYRGIVLQESSQTLSEDTKRNFQVKESFDEITCWNWDKLPSKNDALTQALDWIDIAKALHAPLEASEPLSSTNGTDS